jgi:hypothetical protein
LFDSVILKKALGLLDEHQSRVDLIHYQQAGSLGHYLDEIKGYLSGVLWFELGGIHYEVLCFSRVEDLLSSFISLAQGLSVDDMHCFIDDVSETLVEPVPQASVSPSLSF